MNKECHQQIKQIFLAACELQPRQAAAFLDQACIGEPEIRKEVESLLLHHFSETIIGKSPPDTNAKQLAPPFSLDASEHGSMPAIVEGGSDLERFPPGTMLAGRYRIIGPLGQGGMGDIYRADDLKLDQQVALKFLTRSRNQSAGLLRRYHNEARLSRRVTHPNVVRVYDISETEGEIFISMEYVDGEDLAKLLKRVGRLTSDKTIQIAREVCAGLGAAHDQGILHRDLKPANIMIDSRGQVRIADFGIAAMASQSEDGEVLIGTPLFMAPELFEGRKPTIRSDIYSLGVVLYEAVTGKMPYGGVLHPHDIYLIKPSEIVLEIDAALEEIILKCLERDPKQRPDSAYAIASSLPGGDPLVLALAAGVTPSPSMVAAAGACGAMSTRSAVWCLFIAISALCMVLCLADRTFFLPQAGLVKSPSVLADKAENISAWLGHKFNSQDHWHGFAIDRGFLQYAAATQNRILTWEKLPTGQPPAVCFWYRTGSEQIISSALLGQTVPSRFYPRDPGIVTLRLDGQGRLMQYLATPERAGFPERLSGGFDWTLPFQLAGLSVERFKPIRPWREPPIFADTLAAWEGTYPDNPDMSVRVEGASLGGRLVFFNVVPPWEQNWTDIDEGPSRAPRSLPPIRSIIYVLAIIAGSFLAWNNAKLGRGDKQGAAKIIVFMLFLGLLDWLLGERHVAVISEEIAMFFLWLSRSTLTATIAGVAYFAVEPYVRRFWPQIMISWSRLLSGKFRDPLIGRDLLVGGLCGILIVVVMQLAILLPSILGWPPSLPKLPSVISDLGSLIGLRYKLNILVADLMSTITLTLVVLLLMLVLHVVMRPSWLAMFVSWLLLTILQATATGYDSPINWLTSSVVVAMSISLLVRVGLFALMANLFFVYLIINSPISMDFRSWYAPAGTFTLILVVTLLLYGFFTARSGRMISWQKLLDS